MITRRQLLAGAIAGAAAAGMPRFQAFARGPFDVDATGSPRADAPVLQPWRRIVLDRACGGSWAVAGDIDGDGQAEIVSAQNFDQDDVHFTSAVVAHKLDGRVLWRWGQGNPGRRQLHHDVACQIHDWDGDGRPEIVIISQEHLVEVDGASGREKRRIPIPKGASDCVAFADLSGKGHATDVLVKNRYEQIWALDQRGQQLWTVRMPGGFRTAHQARPIDIDGDGRDEVMAGYAMLNPDGSVRWVFRSKTADLGRGHLDCCRILRKGRKPADTHLVMTCCGANHMAVVDGEGRAVWELSGHHFESIDVGHVVAGVEVPQVVVDIDHRPQGQSPLWVLDAEGRKLGQIMTDESRFHRLIDWTGDETMAIALSVARGVFDGNGKRLATLATAAADGRLGAVLTGDVDGDGQVELMIATEMGSAIYIYKRPRPIAVRTKPPLGTEPNFTLY